MTELPAPQTVFLNRAGQNHLVFFSNSGKLEIRGGWEAVGWWYIGCLLILFPRHHASYSRTWLGSQQIHSSKSLTIRSSVALNSTSPSKEMPVAAGPSDCLILTAIRVRRKAWCNLQDVIFVNLIKKCKMKLRLTDRSDTYIPTFNKQLLNAKWRRGIS